MTEKESKYYRDLKNVTDTAFDEGIQKNQIEVVLNGYRKGYTVEQISDLTGIVLQKIKEIIQQYAETEIK